MLMMVFLSTAVMTVVSLQMMQVNVGFGTSNSAASATTANDLAQSAIGMVRADILAKLDAGTLNPGTYSYTDTISIPNDPANLGGASTVAGSFTATISQYRGNTYLITITSTAGGATAQVSDIIEVQPSPPAYSCAVEGAAVESAILAGNLASVSDANLIAYAQNNCMVKNESPPPSGVLSAAGGTNCTGGNPTYSGSGVLDLGTLSGGCYGDVTGTYTAVQVDSLGYGTIDDYIPNAAIIEIGTMTGNSDYFGNNANPRNILIGSMNSGVSTQSASSWYGLYLGSGSDTVDIQGNFTDSDIHTEDSGATGADTVIIRGNVHNTAHIVTEGGNDTLFLKAITQSSANSDVYAEIDSGPGDDKIYVQANNYGDIYGSGGHDIISCTGIFGGTCTVQNDAQFHGQGGNDIISIDAMLTGGTFGGSIVNGNAGYNIIYAKGLTGSSSIQANGSGNPGSNLVIIGGNRTNSTITAYGSNNVLLLKSGTTASGMTISGFARTITY